MKELAYRRQMQNKLIGQWLVSMHQHNQHQEALKQLQVLKQQRQYVVQNTSRVNEVENRQLGLLGEINDGFLDENVVKRGGKHIPRALNDQLPSAIRRVWGGDLPDLDMQIMNLEDRMQTYEALRDTRDELITLLPDNSHHNSIVGISEATKSDNETFVELRDDPKYVSTNSTTNMNYESTSEHKEHLNRAFALAVTEGVTGNGETTQLDYYKSIIQNAFWVSFDTSDGSYTNTILPQGANYQAEEWSLVGVHFVRVGVEKTADAFGIWANEVIQPPVNVDPFDLYRRTMGPMTFENSHEPKENFAQAEGHTIKVYRRPAIISYYTYRDENGRFVYVPRVHFILVRK